MNHTAPGTLIGIARRAVRGAPMEEIDHALITAERGMEGDCKGFRSPRRQITVLARGAWEAALADLSRTAPAPVVLPWTARRANLFVEGAALPKARGGLVHIGPVLLEVTYPTQPCTGLDVAHPGLFKAVYPDWRGGITCRVVEGGIVRVGDTVTVVLSPPEQRERPPG